MLEVHPPHQAAHGWKDFFIHIATITIGLLIAIGLEQSVEYIHHLGQLRILRQELVVELDENRDIVTTNRQRIDKIGMELARDMALLRAGQAPHVPLGTRLNYAWFTRRPRDGVW